MTRTRVTAISAESQTKEIKMKLYNWDQGKFAEVDIDARMELLALTAAATAVESEEGVVPQNMGDITEGSAFVIPIMIPEGVESGDGRSVDPDALTTRDLPIPLLWQPKTGTGHDGSFIVGRIDSIDRLAEDAVKGLGNALGVFDTGPYGIEAERLVGAKMLRGVSADLDMFEAVVDGIEMAGENFEDEVDTIKSEKIRIKTARVMAATLVAKPSFQECTIELVSADAPIEEELPVTDGIYEESPMSTEEQAEFAMSSIIASAAPVNPPESWFGNPELSNPTPLTVDDDGRVFGHIATWDMDHIGRHGIRPPRSRSGYAYFRTGLVRTSEGTDISVGQLTLAGGHAGLDASAHDAVKHYDDTASAVADVACGEDKFGIWVAGGLRPEVTPEQVRAFRASAPSGDWRPINNVLELVAVCQVNVPGFPVARARVASGHVMALVAAGAQTLHKIKHSQVDELSARLNALEQQILNDKKAELAARFAPTKQARAARLAEQASQARATLAPKLEERAQAAAELTTKREDAIKYFKLHVDAPFKEELHPRTDEGKFKQVLGRLTDLMQGNKNAGPEAEDARASLEKAAQAEDAGDVEGAKAAAGDAAQKLETAADKAGASLPDPENPDAAPVETGGEGETDGVKAHLGDELHKIATDVAAAVGGDDGTADSPVADDALPAPSDRAKPKDAPVHVPTPADDAGPADDAKKAGSDEIPPEFKSLLEDIVDQIGEGVDPVSIASRMDGKLRHWLEGKGFQSPDQLIKVLEKLLQRPIQPGIAQ